MCRYWKKNHTCGHIGDRPYIEICRPGFLTNKVCSDISEDPEARNSFFPCWNCIKQEARMETEEKVRQQEEAQLKASEALDKAAKDKQIDTKIKQERIRREAREKALREHEEEQRLKRQREEEKNRAKTEGNPWESAGKKTRGRKNVFSIGPQPANILATKGETKSPKTEVKSLPPKPDVKKENQKTTESSVDKGGRAGVWGPGHPPRILTKKDNNNSGNTGW